MTELRICSCADRHQLDSNQVWYVDGIDGIGYCTDKCPQYSAAVEARRKRIWQEVFGPYFEALAKLESLRDLSEKYRTC